MLITKTIPIPDREGAPKTNLYIKIVAQEEENLKTKPYIFMLPGGPGANHSHYKDYSCLSDVGNVVFFDPRGCGLSDKGDPVSYTMDNYIQDIEVIRQTLQLDKIFLVGKSYGAMCALGYALSYPNTVDKLILAAGSPSFRNLETAKEHVQLRGTKEQIKVCEKLWNGSFSSNEEVDEYFDLMDPFYSYKIRHGEPTNRPKADYPFEYEPLNQGFGGFLRHFDFENRLDEVKSETLILVGEEDWITDKRHSEMMASKIPSNQLIIFPKSDHSMESDVPDLFFSAMRSFLTCEPTKYLPFQFFQTKEAPSQLPKNKAQDQLIDGCGF